MMRGQGALEYLIIIAAVLAIAAVVVMFITGAFRGVPAGIANCKTSAAQCATQKATSVSVDCTPMCKAACIDPTNRLDVMNNSHDETTACLPANENRSGCGLCIQGKVVAIK